MVYVIIIRAVSGDVRRSFYIPKTEARVGDSILSVLVLTRALSVLRFTADSTAGGDDNFDIYRHNRCLGVRGHAKINVRPDYRETADEINRTANTWHIRKLNSRTFTRNGYRR